MIRLLQNKSDDKLVLYHIIKLCSSTKRWITIFIVALLRTTTDLAGPLALAMVTDSFILKTDPLPGILLMLCSIAFGVLVNYFKQKTCDGNMIFFTRELKKQMNNKLFALSIGDAEQLNTGDILHLYSLDVQRVAQWTGAPLFNFLELVFYILLAAGVMVRQSPLLTGIIVPTTMVIVPLLSRLSSGVSVYTAREKAATDSFLSQSFDLLSNPETIRAWAMSGQIEQRADAQLKHLEKIKLKKGKNLSKNSSISFVISYLPGFITALIGSYFCFHGKITIGFLIAFIQMMMGRFAFVLPQFNAFILQSRESAVAANRMNAFLQKREYTASSPKQTKQGQTKPTVEDAIVFDHVTLKYPDGSVGIQNVSLRIKHGEKVCFAGASGSGKTTAVKALLMYYPYAQNLEGDIWIYGKNSRTMNPEEVYSMFSPVFQNNHLFYGTIAQNIGVSAVEADGLMQRFGLRGLTPKSPVGESASQISGGEGQRIAVSRAVAKKAPVYIFDEPTSALDEKLESKLLTASLESVGNATAIYISHRPGVLKKFDRIIVFDRGQIVEDGSIDRWIKDEKTYGDDAGGVS